MDEQWREQMTKRFNNQVVIVTGGSRGIGLATCQAFAEEGAQVVIASIDLDRKSVV